MGAQARIRYPSKAAIDRAVAAAKSAGIDVAAIEVSPSGGIKVIDRRAIPAVAQNDFDRWEDQL